MACRAVRVLVRSTTDWLYCSSARSSAFCSWEIWFSSLVSWASVALIWACAADRALAAGAAAPAGPLVRGPPEP